MSTTTTAEPLHLMKLQIDNFLKVTALTIDADGKHVVLSGPNTAGKTSTLEAIWAAIKNVAGRDTPEPIHRGAAKATVTVDLGEYVVTRHWTESGMRLVVTGADGSKVARPQDLLNGLLSTLSLDPVQFLDQRPADQVDAVLQLAGVLPPVAAVEQLTGEKIPPRPGESAATYLERLSADETGVIYIRRREAHRLLTQKESAAAEGRNNLALLGGPLKPEEKQTTASEVLGQIEALQQTASMRAKHVAAAEQASMERITAEERLADLQSRLHDKNKAIQALVDEMARLERDKKELTGRIQTGAGIVADLRTEEEQSVGIAHSIADPKPQLQALHQKVKDAEHHNLSVAKRHMAAEQLARLGAETADAKAAHDRLCTVLEQLRSLRANLLAGADLGVTGLSIGDGCLRLNDVDFRQASTAERLTVSCAIAFRQNPRLRLCRVDNAEHLDRAHRDLLLRLATERGWQVIMAAVTDGSQLEVQIVDAPNERNGEV
jgi:AAA domain